MFLEFFRVPIILKNISENLCSLRKVIFGSTNTEIKLEQGTSFNLMSPEDSAAVGDQEKQIREHGDFPKIKEEEWDPEFDNLVEHNEVDVFRNKVKEEEGGFEDEVEDNLLREEMERTCLMFDISEYELQILKEQTEEKECNDVSHQASEVLNREEIIYPLVVGSLCCINMHRANILGFVGCVVPVATVQFCCWTVK